MPQVEEPVNEKIEEKALIKRSLDGNIGTITLDNPSKHNALSAALIGHIGHDLRRCFDMHLNYLEHGAMLPELDLTIFEPIRSRDRAMVNSRR